MRYADRVLLCTHGKFGEELKRSAEMIAGTLDRVKVFSLFPGMTPEELSDKIRTELDSCAAGICLVDIAGVDVYFHLVPDESKASLDKILSKHSFDLS